MDHLRAASAARAAGLRGLVRGAALLWMAGRLLLYPDPDESAPSSDLPGRLVVVRHGATAWSTEGRHTGRTDVPLEEEGRLQAAEVGRRLCGHVFERVLTSPRSRARETCDLAGFSATAEVCEDLSEWDYGAYEGLTTDEIRAERPGWFLWLDGVVDGESLDQLSKRADRVVELARTQSGDVLVFAHAHILRVVCARWIGLEPREAARFVLDPGSLGVLGWEHGVAAVVSWNDAGGDPFTSGRR